MKELLELFLTFAKIGVMTFGGGMAMLPILDLADIFLYGLLRGSEDTFQKKAVE